MDVSSYPLGRYKDNLFHDGAEVKVARGGDAHSGDNKFAFRGGPFAIGRLLFRGHGSFFEDGFRRGEI